MTLAAPSSVAIVGRPYRCDGKRRASRSLAWPNYTDIPCTWHKPEGESIHATRRLHVTVLWTHGIHLDYRRHTPPPRLNCGTFLASLLFSGMLPVHEMTPNSPHATKAFSLSDIWLYTTTAHVRMVERQATIVNLGIAALL